MFLTYLSWDCYRDSQQTVHSNAFYQDMCGNVLNEDAVIIVLSAYVRMVSIP